MRRSALVVAILATTFSSTRSAAQSSKIAEMKTAAASASTFVSLETEDATERLPEPGPAEYSVGPGEALYSERRQTLYKLIANYAVLKEEFALSGRKRLNLPVGTRLGNFFLTDPNRPVAFMRCSSTHTRVKETLLSGSIYDYAVCFREEKGALVPFFFKEYKAPEGVRLSYELVQEVAESEMEGLGRFELLYQGAGGNILRLTYREFTADELARPAFTQEVTYDLAPGEPTEVAFKGARIKILSAGNTAVRYVVESPFKLP